MVHTMLHTGEAGSLSQLAERPRGRQIMCSARTRQDTRDLCKRLHGRPRNAKTRCRRIQMGTNHINMYSRLVCAWSGFIKDLLQSIPLCPESSISLWQDSPFSPRLWAIARMAWLCCPKYDEAKTWATPNRDINNRLHALPATTLRFHATRLFPS